MRVIKIFKNTKAQTSVEYILLLAAMVTIIISIMTNIRDELISDITPCPADDTSLGCSINRSLSTLGTTDPSFRFFRLRR